MGDCAQDQPVRTGSVRRRSCRGARRPREVADRRGVSHLNGSCGFSHRPVGSGSVPGSPPSARRGWLNAPGRLSRRPCEDAGRAGGGGTPCWAQRPGTTGAPTCSRLSKAVFTSSPRLEITQSRLQVGAPLHFHIEPDIDWPRCNGESVCVRAVCGHIIIKIILRACFKKHFSPSLG